MGEDDCVRGEDRIMRGDDNVKSDDDDDDDDDDVCIKGLSSMLNACTPESTARLCVHG